MGKAKQDFEFHAKKLEASRANIDEILTNYKSFFIKALQEAIQETPGLISVSWYGYTPYWNDGEPCTYYSCSDDATFDFGESLEVSVDHIVDLLSSVKSEDYLNMFENDTSVTVYKDSYKTEVYNHD